MVAARCRGALARTARLCDAAPPVKLSMTLPTMAPDCDRERLLAWCRGIDAGPFASLAVGERVAFPNLEVGVALAAAAAVTVRVRIVATLFVAPLHAPALLAKRAASLDVLASGRFVLGLGVGGREEDYRVAGVAFERRHARLDAIAAELRRLWRGEPAIAGGAPIGPAPLQPGGPPLWVAAAGARPLARAARWADGILGFDLGPDPEAIERGVVAVRDAWRKAGRREAPWITTSFWCALGADADARLDAYARRYLAVFGDAAAAALAARCRAAGEARVREAIAQARAAGVDECFLVPTHADPTDLDRFAQLVA
jgi:alkanesulfonate monooxygenase SsuD/methylene tetrahydromethanopterin reductase-like flavin-dependent oxidoreductase (luciferase family)